jgi:hypothetical protein
MFRCALITWSNPLAFDSAMAQPHSSWPETLSRILLSPSWAEVIVFNEDGDGIIIASKSAFLSSNIIREFPGRGDGKYESFTRSLNYYGFKNRRRVDGRLEYVHESGRILRGHPEIVSGVRMWARAATRPQRMDDSPRTHARAHPPRPLPTARA